MYDQFVAELKGDREAGTATRGQKRQAAAATARAASDASAASATAMAGPVLKKPKQQTLFHGAGAIRRGPMGGRSMVEWNELLGNDMTRLFLGESMADKKADSPLLHQLLRTVASAGKAGCEFPSPDNMGREGYQPDRSRWLVPPTSYQLGGTELDKHTKKYREKVSNRRFGHNGTKFFGFALASDGTTRFGRGVVNIALVFKSGEVVFWELKDTSGESKSNKWLLDFIMEVVTSPDFPLDVEDLVTIVMDGACRTAFPLIEDAFKDREDLPNVVCQWCSCHTWNLLLKAIVDIDGIDSLIEECKEYITFVRSHDKPRSMLRKTAGKGLIRWADTRFGTLFLCMDRILDVMPSLRMMVVSDEWDAYYRSCSGGSADMRGKAQAFVTLTLDPTFANRIQKVLELVEPIFVALRICDSDAPTLGIVYQLFLETQVAVEAWEETKFEPVKDGPAGTAFERGKCTLLSSKNHEDTGKGTGDDWTAASILVFRWTKMHHASRTGLIHAAGRMLNPAFRDYDHSADNLKASFFKFLQFYYNDAATADKVWGQWNEYQREDPKGDLFFTDGVEMANCSWAGERRGLGGADWWASLPRRCEARWPELQKLAMKVLSQTSTESAAERHFSLVELVQPKLRASLSPKSINDRAFVRAEIQAELASHSVNALLTVEDLERYDAAAGEDGAGRAG